MAVHYALAWGACAIVILVVFIALAGGTASAWPLAVTALAFSALLFVGEIVDNLPVVQPRYVIAPGIQLPRHGQPFGEPAMDRCRRSRRAAVPDNRHG
jgi:hypothetical protein